MKKIIKSIYLTWRAGQGARRIVVGRITNNFTNGVSFNYISEGVSEAKKYGFIPYEGFPDVERVYTSNVLDIFSHRLIKNERNDSKYFYDFWMINPKMREDNFYLLAMTQGLVPTDNFEFLADFYPIKDLCFISEISGLSTYQISNEVLNIGDVLIAKNEEENQYDKFAVELYKDDMKIGYVKQIHNRVFHNTKRIPTVTVHSVEKFERLTRVFIKVKFD